MLIVRDRLLGRPQRFLGKNSALTSAVRCSISSGRNVLDAVLVQPSNQPARARVLLCHGIGETVEHWLAAQTLLAESGVASLVFNDSGYGKSTGSISALQCEQDAIAAFRSLERRLPGGPIALLGFSLGSGIAAVVAARTNTHLLILCAAYTSLRDAASSIGAPRFLAYLLPDIWNTEQALRTCTS